MKKKGQVFGLSYGMIFSIIIIVAIIFVAFYAIRFFLDTNQCTQVAFFHDSIQSEVNTAWQSGFYHGEFVGRLPTSGILGTGITKVCFGNLTSTASGSDQIIKIEFSKDVRFYNSQANLFIYPADQACGGQSAAVTISHVQILDASGNPIFFCKEVNQGKVSVNMSIDTKDNLVSFKST